MADLIPVEGSAVPETEFKPVFVLPEDPSLEEQEQHDELADVESVFDARYREPFTGLLYLGRLEETCRIAGHTFVLATPGQSERLEMGPVHKPWVNTMTAEQAWRLVRVAAYLQRIDDEPAPEPLKGGRVELRDKFRWVCESIYSETIIEKLFDACLLLEERVRVVIEELDRLGESSA